MIIDLHLHGCYSGATSKDLTIPNLEKWARIKGIDLLTTGDFTHPLWIKHIREILTPQQSGLLTTKTGFPFMLTTEISLVYTQDGKGRRIHNIVTAPSLEVVDQITEWLLKKGRIDYDGRPIFKIPCPEFVESLRKISTDIEVIPAHCLPPEEKILTLEGVKNIKEVQKGDVVLTHKAEFKRVLKKYERESSESLIKIIPWNYGNGFETTGEHPYLAIKAFKDCNWTKAKTCKPSCKEYNCKLRNYKSYKNAWISAKNLEIGDVILFPRYKKIKKIKEIKIGKKKIVASKELYRFIGYYLSEGYGNNRDAISFTFNVNEKEYIEDVILLGKKLFNLEYKKGKSKDNSYDILFYSKELFKFFKNNFYKGGTKAIHKFVPKWILDSPNLELIEFLKGWWRGDKGSTSSINLLDGIKTILIKLGIIPSISITPYQDSLKYIKERSFKANAPQFTFNNLTFIENLNLLQLKEFNKFKRKVERTHSWLDKNYIYLPIRKIEKRKFKGKVYNLEVEKDNSYCGILTCVHNCWTPWFSLFGSNSGFNNIKDCFQDQTKYIHAVETGLSSNPAMNWRLKQLDNLNIVSFSDSHSYWPWRLGREATIIEAKKNYKDIINVLRTGEGLKGTIEVDPNYGKYHFTGHRNCDVCVDPKQSKALNFICPKCGKQMTRGVAERVEELADREEGYVRPNAPMYHTVLPLHELIAAVYGVKQVASKKVEVIFDKLLKNFHSDYNILLNVPAEDLNKVIDAKLTQAIIQNRKGNIKVKPGYDGEYGIPEL